jgi:hypothetical protein
MIALISKECDRLQRKMQLKMKRASVSEVHSANGKKKKKKKARNVGETEDHISPVSGLTSHQSWLYPGLLHSHVFRLIRCGHYIVSPQEASRLWPRTIRICHDQVVLQQTSFNPHRGI